MVNLRRNTCAAPCNLQALTIEEVLASLFVKDKTTGCISLNTVVDMGSCGDVEPAVKCGAPECWETLLKKSVVLDECGRPALRMFYATDEQG